MRLSDSDDGGRELDRKEDRSRDPPALAAEDPPNDPEAFVQDVADRLEDEPAVAANVVGDLIAVARNHEGPPRVAAGEALDAIGRRQPEAFDVWADDLAGLAGDADEDLAFFGLRALAQLAATDANAAAKGLDAALNTLGAPSPSLNQAAISVLAEVGPTAPEAVRRADRPIAEALAAEDPTVRTAAAIAAGRLLGTAPNAFPRTATALLDALDDDHEEVWTYAHVSLANFVTEHPENVPQKPRALAALAGVTDDELGLRRGAVGEAMSALVALEFDGRAAVG